MPTLLPYRAWIMSGMAKDDDSDDDDGDGASGDDANADSTTSSEENVGGGGAAAAALATQDLYTWAPCKKDNASMFGGRGLVEKVRGTVTSRVRCSWHDDAV
jgi:hypothetical protein